jgi:hypothetical protein
MFTRTDVPVPPPPAPLLPCAIAFWLSTPFSGYELILPAGVGVGPAVPAPVEPAGTKSPLVAPTRYLNGPVQLLWDRVIYDLGSTPTCFGLVIELHRNPSGHEIVVDLQRTHLSGSLRVGIHQADGSVQTPLPVGDTCTKVGIRQRFRIPPVGEAVAVWHVVTVSFADPLNGPTSLAVVLPSGVLYPAVNP